jgi:hypothetical protein
MIDYIVLKRRRTQSARSTLFDRVKESCQTPGAGGRASQPRTSPHGERGRSRLKGQLPASRYCRNRARRKEPCKRRPRALSTQLRGGDRERHHPPPWNHHRRGLHRGDHPRPQDRDRTLNGDHFPRTVRGGSRTPRLLQHDRRQSDRSETRWVPQRPPRDSDRRPTHPPESARTSDLRNSCDDQVPKTSAGIKKPHSLCFNAHTVNAVLLFLKKQTPAVMLAENTSLLQKSVSLDDAMAVVVGVTSEDRQLIPFKIVQGGCLGGGEVNPDLHIDRKSFNRDGRSFVVHLTIRQNSHPFEIHQAPADAEFAILLNNDDDALVVDFQNFSLHRLRQLGKSNSLIMLGAERNQQESTRVQWIKEPPQHEFEIIDQRIHSNSLSEFRVWIINYRKIQFLSRIKKKRLFSESVFFLCNYSAHSRG